jgi:tetratricopeptide (TPR) repeat protein
MPPGDARMRTKFKAVRVICLLCLLIPVQALGSRPVDTIIVGGVIDGMLFDVGDTVPVQKAYMITPVPAVNLTPYEGKKIRWRGKLTPGDRFQPDSERGIEVLGPCDQEMRAAIAKELPQAYRTRAEAMAENNDWSRARKYINKAIQLENSDCSLYLTRAKFYQNQGKLAEAVVDAQRAVQHGCKRYPDWAFLAALLEKAGKNPAALDAYVKAVGVCGYKPDRDKFLNKIIQLGGSTDNIPLGKDGGKEF